MATSTTTRKTRKLWLIKFALTVAGKKMKKVLDKKSKNCRRSQYDVLRDIISYTRDTIYGREHGFNTISSVADFQKQVPINTYESLEPYIKRHTQGEENVLFPGKPVIYATTSGTTKEPKWIPITEKYYKECYNGLSKLWFYSLLKENPAIFDGPEISIVGKPLEGKTADGTPYGSFSGHVYHNIPKFLKAVHVIPDEVISISDYSARYYVIMRLTLEYHIRLIITGNPSTLIEMHKTVQSHIDSLIDDIENGTLNHDIKLEPEIRAAVEAMLRPNLPRAQELGKLKEQHSPLYPKHYWPTLQVINTWKCGNSGLYLQHTKDYFAPSTVIREFSYLATEARAGIVLNNNQMASILAAHLLFFEFIKKDEIDHPNPRVYLAHELEVGEYYYIIVTTPSGLYRYNMNDIVRIEGFYNEFPQFLFIQKGAGITNLTGEKLHETQFLEAMEQTSKASGLSTEFHIAFGDLGQSCYQVFIEFTEQPDQSARENFAAHLDTKLKEFNMEYRAKRDSRRLGHLILKELPKDSFEIFKAECMNRGYRDGQFKLTHLMIDDIRMGMFNHLARH